MNWWYVTAIAVFIYLPLAFLFASWLGRMMKGQDPDRCEHNWQPRGYGGAGWVAVKCSKCNITEIM